MAGVVLEQAGILPDFVTGTSAGAVVGAIYAAGYRSPDLLRIAGSLFDVIASGAATRLERLALDGSGLGARHGKQLRTAAATRERLPPDPRFGVRRKLDLPGVP